MLIGICACMLLFLPPLGSYEGTKYNDIIYDCFKELILQIAIINLPYLMDIVRRKVVIRL